ncbi:hypothetical protein OSB04_un000511 [Centaurea solstitialis]|uniref:Uncharacterized protein n=1 Tax=Centaurea solstitialis TaxID=347529 RepID=A0AA38VRT2_9ASTR|nr:hypothetical protein OSB04_un000511 [Centaurea solstitialis]
MFGLQFPIFSKTFYTLPHFVKHALSHLNPRAEVSAVELTFTGSADQFVVKSIESPSVPTVSFEFSHSQTSNSCNHRRIFCGLGRFIPNSAWDFPALETLNLSNMKLIEGRGTGDKSVNFFSKCVNLKDLTLHQCSMNNLDVFNVCAPQLSNLTITSLVAFPKVFNVVAPKLENLTATDVCVTTGSNFLQLSTKGLDSLEKVNLSLLSYSYEKERYVPQLLYLFTNFAMPSFLSLIRASFSVYFLKICVFVCILCLKALPSCLDQVSYEPCLFNNLKCLKINMVPLKQKDCILKAMATQVINYLLESSPSATSCLAVHLLMTLQMLTVPPHKRSRHAVDMGIRSKKVVKWEEEKQQPKTMVEGKRMLETKILMPDEVIAPSPSSSLANTRGVQNSTDPILTDRSNYKPTDIDWIFNCNRIGSDGKN